MRRKKKLIGLVTAVTAVAIVLTGTFAFTDLGQSTGSTSSGVAEKYDVTLIEDYPVAPTNWKVKDAALKKEVKVKNTGVEELDFGDLYVRVQLKEYMETLGFNYVYSEKSYMIDTMGKFYTYATETEALAEFPDHVVEQQEAYIKTGENGPKWYVVPNGTEVNVQSGKKLLIGVVDKQPVPLIPGTSLPDETWDNTSIHTWGSSDDTQKFAEYIKWNLGQDVLVLDNQLGFDTWDGNPVDKWILDNTDVDNAWAYWGMPLEPGDITSDLLSRVQLIKQPKEETFRYDVHAKLEAVSFDDMWTVDGTVDEDGEIIMSPAPEKIIKAFTDNEVKRVTSVIITSAGNVTTVSTNSTLKLTAEVKGTNNPVDTVVWAVSGDASGATTISNAGLLTVPSGVTASTLTITATSTFDNSKVGEFIVTIQPAWYNNLTGTSADQGKTFTVDGYAWKVLHVDASGNLLITTQQVIGGNEKFDLSGNNDYSQSNLKVKIDEFYQSKLLVLKDFAQGVNISNDTEGSIDGVFTLSTVSLTANKTAFALSIAEVKAYLPTDAARIATFETANYPYWLRSPITGGTEAVVDTTGAIVGYAPTKANTGIRPALWIKLK